MDDSALVGVEWTELLLHPRIARLLREVLRHPAQLDVLAFAVGERVHEHALVAGKIAAERHVHDVLQRFEWLSAMTDEELRRLARVVQSRSICGDFDVHWGLNLESGGE